MPYDDGMRTITVQNDMNRRTCILNERENAIGRILAIVVIDEVKGEVLKEPQAVIWQRTYGHKIRSRREVYPRNSLDSTKGESFGYEIVLPI